MLHLAASDFLIINSTGVGDQNKYSVHCFGGLALVDYVEALQGCKIAALSCAADGLPAALGSETGKNHIVTGP